MHLVARGVAPRERGDLSTRLGVGSENDFDLLQARSEEREAQGSAKWLCENDKSAFFCLQKSGYFSNLILT